jgi:putative oxidoreductase
MLSLYKRFVGSVNHGKDAALFLLRCVLAYGFWEPAKTKWADIHSVAEWFGTLNIPAPTFQAYLAASTEMAGVFMLTLGLGTRIISIPLMITMLVAIKTVHWANGFPAGDNGYEIPLYFLLMLFTLLSFGSGKISVDYFIKRSVSQKNL